MNRKLIIILPKELLYMLLHYIFYSTFELLSTRLEMDLLYMILSCY